MDGQFIRLCVDYLCQAYLNSQLTVKLAQVYGVRLNCLFKFPLLHNLFVNQCFKHLCELSCKI